MIALNNKMFESVNNNHDDYVMNESIYKFQLITRKVITIEHLITEYYTKEHLKCQ